MFKGFVSDYQMIYAKNGNCVKIAETFNSHTVYIAFANVTE